MNLNISMTGIFQDVHYALRQLRKSPAFTAIAVLTLALGIGANTAIFSMVQGVVFAPLSFSNPDRLVTVWENNLTLKHAMSASAPDFRDWKRTATSFQQIAAFTRQSFDLTSPGSAEHLAGKEISSDFFGTLGTKLSFGRDFSPEEDMHGGAPSVIISEHLWSDRFSRSPEVLGKSVTLGGKPYTIVGVLPPRFHFEGDADIYTPLGQEDPLIVNDRTIHPLFCVARLKAGVSIAQAQGEMNSLQENIDRLYPSADRGVGIALLPLKQVVVGDTGRTLLLLLGAVGMVLLIACANVASLMLARSARRSREFAIRAALGANRARLVRQVFTESLLLSAAGGVLGALLAVFATRPLLAILPGFLPRSENINVNVPVLLFTLAVSLAVGIVFGLAPALKSWNYDPQTSLKAESQQSGRSHHQFQNILVIGQFALTLVLLAGAGLLFRTIRHLWEANPGFDTQNIITFKAGLSLSVTSPSTATAGAKERVAYQQLIERIRHIPGVRAADLTVLVPLSQTDNAGPFWVGAQQPASIAEAPRASFYWTGPDYLKTMGIALQRGRFFTANDTTKSERVVVIDTVLADTYFRDVDPVDRTIMIPHWGMARVVGVVNHVRHWDMGNTNRYTQNQIYAPFYQLQDAWIPEFRGEVTIAVRTSLGVSTLLPAIKAAVYGGNQAQPIYDIHTMQEIVSQSMSPQRLPMILFIAFAALALLLALVGIYGVISYSMSQRIREIGVRMALGARREDILRMVVGQGLFLALSGLAIGVAAALILTRVLSSFSHLLYGVSVYDPLTFATASVMLIAMAVLASYIPARRAAKVDPMVALRYE